MEVINLPYEFYSTEGHEKILEWFKENGFQTVKLYPEEKKIENVETKVVSKRVCVDCGKTLGSMKFSAEGGGFKCYTCYDENR